MLSRRHAADRDRAYRCSCGGRKSRTGGRIYTPRVSQRQAGAFLGGGTGQYAGGTDPRAADLGTRGDARENRRAVPRDLRHFMCHAGKYLCQNRLSRRGACRHEPRGDHRGAFRFGGSVIVACRELSHGARHCRGNCYGDLRSPECGKKLAVQSYCGQGSRHCDRGGGHHARCAYGGCILGACDPAAV